MGTFAARKARQILENATRVVAIELLCGAQAMDLLTKGRPGRGVERAYGTIRSAVSRLDQDRVLAGDIAAVAGLVEEGRLVARVEEAVGPLE